MNLLAIENCRLTALFQIARIKGQLFLPEAALLLGSRYNFSTYPQSFEELSAEKIEFRHGQFEDVAIQTFEIYTDGVVISSRSDTDIIDLFLEDLSEWLKEDRDISFIKTHSINKIYDSTIIIQTDKSILKPLDTLTKIANVLQSELKETSGLDVKYEPFGWTLSADPTQNPALKPVSFRIERRVGIEFSMQTYISAAPLKLKQHVALLEKLESLV